LSEGFLVLDKPAGMTSHDVVSRCRRVFKQKKVGHAGTLDPGATGVLLVALGTSTRLMQFVSGLPKRYTAEVVLGLATTTLDDEGEVTGSWDMSAVGLEAARQAAVALTGAITQVPPMVSALKVGGRRLHELARAGLEVQRVARPVNVTRFEVNVAPGPAGPKGPVLAIDVDCSSGTYVRSLAADLGAALGGGAHLRRLRRTAVGPFTAAEAVPLLELETAEVPEQSVIAPAATLERAGLASVTVGAGLAAAAAHGKVLPLSELAAAGADGDGPWAVLAAGGELLAVYALYAPLGSDRPRLVKPTVVLRAAG